MERQRIEQSGLQWHKAVAEVMKSRLGWSSIHALAELLESDALDHTSGAIKVGFFGTPNAHGSGWTIEGGCHHGSHIHADTQNVMVASCGGHWVEARRITSNDTRFMTDRHLSDRSWGDSLVAGDPYGDAPIEELEAAGFTAATGAELEFKRAQELERLFDDKQRALGFIERQAFDEYLETQYK